jgi:hypothetical protein
MGFIDAIGGVGLDAINGAAAKYVGDAIEHEVAARVRRKMDLCVAREVKRVDVKVARFFLQSRNGELSFARSGFR